MLLKTVFVLFCLAGAAAAGTISEAACQPFSSDSEAVTASCQGGNSAAQSAVWATATSHYGELTASASSLYGFNCGGIDLRVCQPSSGATAEFLQTATFTGLLGRGTLVLTHVSMGRSQDETHPEAWLAINGVRYADYDFPGVLSIPITFGIPVTLDGWIRAYASDAARVDKYLSVGSFSVLDSAGTQARSWSSLGNMSNAVYAVDTGSVSDGGSAAAVPEPALGWLAGLGMAALAATRRRLVNNP